VALEKFPHPAGRIGDADERRDTELSSDDRPVGEDAAGLEHEPRGTLQDRRPARIRVDGDEYVAGRDVLEIGRVAHDARVPAATARGADLAGEHAGRGIRGRRVGRGRVDRLGRRCERVDAVKRGGA